ncbi:MAG: nucleoside monophosphate kinase [Nanoarchaeota archaeon]|nr:nucleoside monophosphate kinase [Nanoarchaeota archaeon]
MKIIFLGKPAAGKGTQARRLAEELDIPYISTGEFFRAELKQGTELGKMAYEQYWKEGKLVPDDITNKIVESQIKNYSNFILDGYPRTLGQAKFLDNITNIDLVINIDISDKDLMHRIEGRRYCPQCNANYNVNTAPKPKNDNLCDKCNISLEIRPDEKPKALAERLREYNEKTEPLIEFYKNKNILNNIEGNRSIENIYQEILSLAK